MCGFESCDCLFSRDGGERIQKFVEAVVPREIVDEIAEGHAGPDKDRRAPKDVGVAVYVYPG